MLGGGQQFFRTGGHFVTIGRSIKQLRAEIVLQFIKAAGDCGITHIQFLGSPPGRTFSAQCQQHFDIIPIQFKLLVDRANVYLRPSQRQVQ